MKEINQKKLLERFLTIEAALNVSIREVQEAKKELTKLPPKPSRQNDIYKRMQEDWIKRQSKMETKAKR